MTGSVLGLDVYLDGEWRGCRLGQLAAPPETCWLGLRPFFDRPEACLCCATLRRSASMRFTAFVARIAAC